MTAHPDATPAPLPHRPPERQRRDRPFFVIMAVVIALTVFAGFSRSYFLKGLFGTRVLTPFFHLHGIVFSCWVALFVTQIALAARGRIDIHRKLGMAAVALAPLMVVIGWLAAVDSARRGFTPPGGPPPLVFFMIPVADLLVFTILVTAGMLMRRSPETHKRLMLLSMISILTPAIARLPGVAAAGPPAFLGLTDLFIVVCFVYDRVAHRRIHRAFLWGGLLIVLSQPLRFAIAQSGPWLTFARWVTAR